MESELKKKSDKKFYVTTPIYYVNARPHLGSLYSTLLADVAARWNQLLGKRSFLLTGTDEHGQKIAQAAAAAGQEPKAFVDSFTESFKNTWHTYEIDYNHFIRTTDPEHVKAVQAWIVAVQKKGEIYKSHYEGYYCIPCETFVTEKDQQSNQAPSCLICTRPTTLTQEESYFFKLSAYQDRLLAFYREHPDFITPTERSHEVIAFVKSGLKDLAISRTTISWGIPFPGDPKHVCYVWVDALLNYISAIGYSDERKQADFKFWWPADLQVLGKDIIRFHAVYWPAFLMALGLQLPKKLLVHGWIKMGDQKMSKSLGNVIDPQALAAAYGVEPVRYYLVRHLAVTQDAPFTIDDLVQRINADLVHDLSNLVHRMLTLAHAQNLVTVHAPAKWSHEEAELYATAHAIIEETRTDMEQYLFHRAYGHVWKLISATNAYFHAQEPWKVAKTDRARFEIIMSATAHALHMIAVLIWPVMPKTALEILESLVHPDCLLKQLVADPTKTHRDIINKLLSNQWQETFALTPHAPLFVPVAVAGELEKKSQGQTAEKQQESKKTMTSAQSHMQTTVPIISIDDFSKVELLVGTIKQIDIVPKSDKLYVLQVDLGAHGMRQICSGVRQHFAPEELLGKQGVFVANLAPRMMMGLESQGMMLFAADAAGKLQLVTVAGSVPDGTKLR